SIMVPFRHTKACDELDPAGTLSPITRPCSSSPTASLWPPPSEPRFRIRPFRQRNGRQSPVLGLFPTTSPRPSSATATLVRGARGRGPAGLGGGGGRGGPGPAWGRFCHGRGCPPGRGGRRGRGAGGLGPIPWPRWLPATAVLPAA